MCTIVDNSARVEAERRVAVSETELLRVTDALPMLVSYVDREHVYRFANIAYETWFGMSPAGMIGRHVRDVIGDAPYQDRRADLDRGLAGERFTAETTMPHRDGVTRRLEVRYVPRVEPDGSISGVYVLGWGLDQTIVKIG
jgi:PAS domain S-box-containing protein